MSQFHQGSDQHGQSVGGLTNGDGGLTLQAGRPDLESCFADLVMEVLADRESAQARRFYRWLVMTLKEATRETGRWPLSEQTIGRITTGFAGWRGTQPQELISWLLESQ